MESCRFELFLEQISSLTRKQCAQVLVRLKEKMNQGSAAEVIEEALVDRLQCPRCHGRALYRHGVKNGLQRFRCRGCGRTFNSLTGTPLARLRYKDRWLDYSTCLLDTRSVRNAASRVDVSRNTSMRWRHRFLAITKLDRPGCLTGIAEADETFLLESQKGSRHMTRPARKRAGKASQHGMSMEQVCIVVARDRTGATHDFVTGRGPVTAAQLRQHLPPILARDTLLVTDANRAYQAFARQTGYSHADVNANVSANPNVSVSARTRNAIHLHNVNSYHSRFHTWLKVFNGVATRYLTNYLGWRWAIDQERICSPEILLKAAIGVFNT